MVSMSQVLVPSQKQEQAFAPVSTRGIQILESRIDSISLSRGSLDASVLRGRPFDFDVQLSEKGRTGNSLRVRYAFSFGRPSAGQVCKIIGEAVVRFAQFDADKDLQYLGTDITNELAVEIFRRNFESTYLLHETMGMQAPSPWITEDLSIE